MHQGVPRKISGSGLAAVNFSGNWTLDLKASTRILGDALAGGTGDLWIYFAGFLGALGSFFSGSNTISNLTFGPIQLRIAQDLGLSSTTMLALQTVGAAMGNMVDIKGLQSS